MDQTAMQKPIERAQSTIKSFFQPRTTNYAQPPTPQSATNNTSRPSPVSSSAQDGTSAGTNSQPPVQTKTPEPLKTKLPPQASISKIYPKHVQPLRRINGLLLPINYPDSFYHKIIDPNTVPNFSRVILWHDPSSKSAFEGDAEPKVVGGIVCRLERSAISRASSIYVQSLVLLSPYRKHGLAAAALDAIIESIVTLPITEFPVTSIYAHVWTENNEGLDWYKARGFTQEPAILDGYYSRLKPNSAWILRRPLNPSDHLRYRKAEQPSTLATNVPKVANISPALTATGSSPTTDAASPTSNLNGLKNRPDLISRASSFQNSGPGHEWNDLPDDILKPSSSSSSLQLPSHLAVPGETSAASSRSSSRSRTVDKAKKKRQYPAGAFGTG